MWDDARAVIDEWLPRVQDAAVCKIEATDESRGPNQWLWWS